MFATGSSIGGALACMAGGALIAKFETIGATALPLIGTIQPWQMVFLVNGLPGVIIAAMIFPVPEPLRQYHKVDLAVPDGVAIRFLKSNRRYFICHFLGFGPVAALACGTAA